jgi:hypothetical protein
MNKYRLYGILIFVFTLFFTLAIAQGQDRILYSAGFVYALVFIFHTQLRRFILPRVKRPLFAYGLLVVLNGLLVEALAYISNISRIQAGEEVFLFSTSSLLADLLLSLPYYLAFALIFVWILKRFRFSTLQFGLTVWFAQAVSVDIFSHFFELLSGNILGFFVAGITMLSVLHAPIVIFEEKFNHLYPARSTSFLRYPLLFVLQMIPIPIPFIIIFIKTVLFT